MKKTLKSIQEQFGITPKNKLNEQYNVDRLIKQLEDGKKKLMKMRQMFQKLDQVPQTAAGKFLNSVGLPDIFAPDSSGVVEEIDKKIKEVDKLILKLQGGGIVNAFQDVFGGQVEGGAVANALKNLNLK